MKSQKRHQGTWSKTGEHYVVMSSVSLVRVFSSVEDPKIQLDPFLPSISPSLHLRLRRWVCSLENDKKCLFDGNSLMRREYMECQLPHHFLMFHYYFAGVRSAWKTVWVLFIALVTHFRPVSTIQKSSGEKITRPMRANELSECTRYRCLKFSSIFNLWLTHMCWFTETLNTYSISIAILLYSDIKSWVAGTKSSLNFVCDDCLSEVNKTMVESKRKIVEHIVSVVNTRRILSWARKEINFVDFCQTFLYFVTWTLSNSLGKTENIIWFSLSRKFSSLENRTTHAYEWKTKVKTPKKYGMEYL